MFPPLQSRSPSAHLEVDHRVVDFETGCNTQMYLAFFTVVASSMMLTNPSCSLQHTSDLASALQLYQQGTKVDSKVYWLHGLRHRP
jgi:hypothetical protein